MSLELILAEMAVILETNDEQSMASVIRSIEVESKNSMMTAAAKAISLFRGTGSLSDVVLQPKGVPSADNDQFDQLRNKLFIEASNALKRADNSVA